VQDPKDLQGYLLGREPGRCLQDSPALPSEPPMVGQPRKQAWRQRRLRNFMNASAIQNSVELYSPL